ncbi:hypothetical protein I6A60_01830 [Frankia sp. AgB1.9]|uniref:hypothetical protein n=1 Tax=unclassified Frankia TaxID=2632575 RepID=UPI001931A45E|nr:MULTISPECIES: hypothetical protein [unclassified Frankia]MBL7494453.1 hypothetical protein [Frankia sp. AgW1.1]MBL7546625.1 hypothetical protein [Frankia sp. AgB1.9]MBL7622389.1 hypothetical protein [Frankia sp. AgB1.8]
MTIHLPGTSAEHAPRTTPDQPWGVAVWSLRQAADDLANMTIGVGADAMLPATEVNRMLRRHGLLAGETTAPALPPWTVLWPTSQHLFAIPAVTVTDAEALRAAIRATGGEALVAVLVAPDHASELAASARVAVEADQAAARRRAEMQSSLTQLVPSAPPPASTGSAGDVS